MLDALPLGYPLPLTYPETLVKYYVFLDGEYDLAVYNKRYEFLDGEYDLNAYLKQYTHLSGEYDLNAYTKKYAYLDGEYALLAYAKTYHYLDGEYDLNAYTKKYSYLDGEYALLAYEVFKAFVANLRTGAHSTYSNFDFNSLSGSYGAKSDGIYQLTGTTDNGTAIATLLDTGKTDFQSSFQKRLTDAYMGLKSNGTVKLTITTESSTTPYTVTGTSALENIKIPLGRGARGRYWQIKLENQTGSSFVLDSIELLAEILGRRDR